MKLVLINKRGRRDLAWLNNVVNLICRIPNKLFRIHEVGTVEIYNTKKDMKNIGAQVHYSRKEATRELNTFGIVTLITRKEKLYQVKKPSSWLLSHKECRTVLLDLDTMELYNTVSGMTKGKYHKPCLKSVKCPPSRTSNAAIHQEEISLNTSMYRSSTFIQGPFQPVDDTEVHRCSITYSFSRMNTHCPLEHVNNISTDGHLGSVVEDRSNDTEQSSRVNEATYIFTSNTVRPDPQSDMSVLESRLSTFEKEWPHTDSTEQTEALAKCGFYYTGIEDLVRCYQCGIELQTWRTDDDPLLNHLQNAPGCRHIHNTYDECIIQTYLSKTENTAGSATTTTELEGACATHPPSTRNHDYNETDKRIESFADWPAHIRQKPNELSEAGFYFTGVGDVVRCFHCDGGIQNWEPSDDPWIEHAYWFPTCEYVKEKAGEDFIQRIQNAATEDSTDEEEDDVDLESIVGCLHSERTRSVSPEPEFEGSSEEGLMQERDYYRNKLLCILCEERNSSVLFLPCGHHKMCEQCAEDVSMCPICEREVVQKVKTFML